MNTTKRLSNLFFAYFYSHGLNLDEIESLKDEISSHAKQTTGVDFDFAISTLKDNDDTPRLKIESENLGISIWIGEGIIMSSVFAKKNTQLDKLYRLALRIMESDAFKEIQPSSVRVSMHGQLCFDDIKHPSIKDTLPRLSPILAQGESNILSFEMRSSAASDHTITYKYEIVPDETSMNSNKSTVKEIAYELNHEFSLEADTRTLENANKLLIALKPEEELDNGLEQARRTLG